MKSYCIKDNKSGYIFKILMSEEEVFQFFEENPHMKECVNCVECDDAPSITLE